MYIRIGGAVVRTYVGTRPLVIYYQGAGDFLDRAARCRSEWTYFCIYFSTGML